jgi:signal peptidase II
MAYAIVAVLILILDQAVKYWTTVNLAVGESSPIIPGFIEFTNIHNTGAAHGILEGYRWLFIVLTIAFTAAIIVLLSKNIIRGKFGRWTIVMVMAGGLGNCIDRIINGYVVDMFNFQFMKYPVFNVADMFISVCGVLFCLYLIFYKSPKPEETEEASPAVPRTRERPIKGPDYMAQLQKPVADAKLELRSPGQEAAPEKTAEPDCFREWDTPREFENSPQSSPPAPAPNKAQAPIKSAPPENPKQPEQPAKKTDNEFSLDSILEEFKDK